MAWCNATHRGCFRFDEPMAFDEDWKATFDGMGCKTPEVLWGESVGISFNQDPLNKSNTSNKIVVFTIIIIIIVEVWCSTDLDYDTIWHVRGDAGLAASVGDMAGYFLWPLKATPTAPMGSATVMLGFANEWEKLGFFDVWSKAVFF